MTTQKTMVIRSSMFDEGERARHAALIVLTGAEIGRDFRLRKAPMVIGRSASAQIRLPDDGASREHARVEYHGTGDDADPSYAIEADR